MSLENLCFVTGNSNKLREVSQILKRNLSSKAIDLVEVQGSSKEIARAKVLEAIKYTKTATITEDTALYFNTLGQLPGPYVKYFLEMGNDNLVKILDSFDDKSAYALCTVAYSTADGQVVLFEGKTEGRIVSPRNTIGISSF
jgi:inosine triphosphate pyrophosphatase